MKYGKTVYGGGGVDGGVLRSILPVEVRNQLLGHHNQQGVEGSQYSWGYCMIGQDGAG